MQNSGGKPTFSGFNFASTPNSSTGVTSSVNSTPGTGLNIGSGLATSSAFGGFSFGSSMPKTLGGFSFGTPGTTTSHMAAPAFGTQSTPATGGVFTAPKTTATGLQFGTPGSASAATTGLFSGTLTTTPATGLFSGSQTNTQSIGLGFSGSLNNTPSTQATGLFSGSQMSTPSTQATGLFSAKLPSTSSSQATGLQFGSGKSTTLFSGFAAPPQTKPSFSFGTSTTQNTQAAAVTKAVTGPMFGSAASGTGTASRFNFSSGAAISGGLSFGTQETAATASTTAKPAGNLTFGSSTTTTQGTLTGGTPGFGMVQTSTASTTTVGGITFGTVTSATGQTTTAGTGFKFGGPSATIQGTSTTGLTLGTTQPQGLIASTKAAGQTGALPAFGLGQSTTGFNLSGLLSGQAKTSAISTGTTSSSSSGQTTSATTTSGFSLSGTTLGNTSKTTSLLPTITTTTSTTSTTNPGFSLTTSQPTTTSSTGFQLGGGPFGNLGTTATTSGFKLPSSVSNSGTTSTANAATSSTTGSTATTTTTTSAEKYTYKQLEEQVNKWNIELEEMEKSFLEQAAQVNVADRELMENGEKITALHSEVERAKAEQNRLDQELDFLLAQQNELEDLLKPLEEYVKQQSAEHGQEPDREREKIYKMAEKCDGQLKGMVQDLREIIDYLNATNASHQQEQNPIMQIAKILNVHMDSLQWIDQNSALLQKRVDEIARLSEMRKKEHERSFGLGFD